MSNELEFCYIARDEGGKAVCATVDGRDKRTADDLAEWVREGLTIERVTVGWVRKHLFTTDQFDTSNPTG